MEVCAAAFPCALWTGPPDGREPIMQQQQAPMYVRTTYATGDPARIESSLELLRREAPDLLAQTPGYRGFGLFADREMGKISMGSWWESEQARTKSDLRL